METFAANVDNALKLSKCSNFNRIFLNFLNNLEHFKHNFQCLKNVFFEQFQMHFDIKHKLLTLLPNVCKKLFHLPILHLQRDFSSALSTWLLSRPANR